MELVAEGHDLRPVLGRFGHFDLEEQLICLATMGSRSHGLYVPPEEPMGTDDLDVMAIYIPPVAFELGLRRVEHWQPGPDDDGNDVIGYSLRKLVSLMLKSNPNVLGLLWLRPADYLYTNPLFQELVQQRGAFMSRGIYAAFCGYARAQLQRMEQFNKQGYMGRRRQLIMERVGYDCRNAAHCIRLLRMGVEALQTGRLNVFRRGDGQELMAIKKGQWALERVKDEAERLFERARRAAERTTLPEAPDRELAERLLVRLQLTYWFPSVDLEGS